MKYNFNFFAPGLRRERSAYKSHGNQELLCGQKVHQELRGVNKVAAACIWLDGSPLELALTKIGGRGDKMSEGFLTSFG
jgi:hypothetical protein